jgi:hypothetical protein
VIARAVVHNEGVIDDSRILTNRRVCFIDSVLDGEGRASVYVCGTDDTNCVIYKPFKVISTVSEGYMDVNGEDMFDSSMSDKLAKMRSVFTRDNGMPLYKEIKFQFDTKWWDDAQFMAVETEDYGKCNWWQSYHTKWSNEFFYGSNTLVCVLTTEDFEELEPLNENKVQLLLKNSLGHTDAFKAAVAPYVDSSDARRCMSADPHGWDEDPGSLVGCRYYLALDENPYWEGSYPNWKPGGTKAAFDDFTRAHSVSFSGSTRNVTHIAGDATCYRHWGYQHAAYFSGVREAQYVVQELHVEKLGGMPLPESYEPTAQYCDDEPGGGIANAFVRPSKMDV